jgi:hypothetical protein
VAAAVLGRPDFIENDKAETSCAQADRLQSSQATSLSVLSQVEKQGNATQAPKTPSTVY